MATGTIPKSVKATLYIDGKPAEQSIKSVEQSTRSLERELKTLTIGTDQWNAKMKQVGANKSYLADLRKEANGLGGAFNKIKSELGALGTLAAGYLGFQFITSQFSNIISGNAQLSDSLADMRRVIGLTEAGVINLDSSLGKLDTRTSKSGLREIAVIAGKLGVAKDGILSFVEATDKLVVALGDELGNADQVTTQLGKILNVFEGEVTGDNITRLGNAMVKLANDGVASAGFISEFTQKVSGIAKTAGLSLPATLALGAGLEELGAKSDTAASSVQALLVGIANDMPKAAKIAGIAQQDFGNLLPEQQLLAYAKGLAANKEAFSEVAEAMGAAGENGVKVQATLALLGNNVDMFTSKIEDTIIAITGYNEINNAFDLKNQTLGAQLDKLGKQFNKLTTNTTLVDMLSKLVVKTVEFVNWIDRNAAAIKNITKLVVIAGLAWGAYRLAVLFANTEKLVWIKTLLTAETIETLAIIRTTAWGVVTATLSGNFRKAKQELQLLNFVMGASPWGIVLAGVVALGAALYLYNGEMSTAAKIQKNFNDIQNETNKAIAEETSKIGALLSVIKDENASKEQKLAAVKKLREIMPEYLKTYTQEEILAGKATDAVLKYINAIRAKAAAEATGKKLTEVDAKISDIDTDLKNGYKDSSTWQERLAAGFNQGNKLSTSEAWIKTKLETKKELQKEADELRDDFKTALIKTLAEDAQPEKALGARTVDETRKYIQGKIDALKADYDNLLATNKKGQSENLKQQKILDDQLDRLNGKEGKSTKTKKTPAEKLNDKKLSDTAKLQEDLNKIILENYQKTLEGYDKEIDAADVYYQELKARARGNKAELEQIEDLKQQAFSTISKKYADKAEEESREKTAKFLTESKNLEREAQQIKEEFAQSSLTGEAAEIAAIRKKYADKITALKQSHSEEIQETIEFKEALLALEDQENAEVQRKTAALAAAKEAQRQKDIKDAKQQSLESITSAAFQIFANNARAETDLQLAEIEKRRQAELSAKNLTEAQKKKINDKYDKEAAAEKLKAWKAEQRAAIGQAVINGALAVIKALPNVPLAIGAGVAAAAQLAVIVAQKPPKYATGGFSNQEPAGYVSSATMFTNSASGRPFIAGEAGKEWIAPNWMLTDPRFAGTIGNLEMARKDKRAFAAGGFNGDQSSSVSSTSSTKILESLMMKMIDAQNKANDKQVILSMRTFEEEQAKRVAVRNGASG